jgi:hypothetical protein
MIKRILFFCAALALAFSVSAPRASADDPGRLSQLSISVWPEYDTPTVLVILDGKFADTTNSSRQVSVLIPSKAKLHVATYANADGTLAKEQAAQSSDLGDGYARVTFSVPAANFWLEYYDDALQGNPDKTLDFSLKAPSPADQVSLEVQQPLKATNFTISPATPNTRSENGFTYFDSSIGNVTAGQVISAKIKYTKTDPSPSVSPAAAPASVPSTPVTTTSSPWGNTFLIVAIVVLGLTAVLGFFMLQQQRSRRLAPATSNSRNGRRVARGARPASLGGVFCTQCGRPLGRDDNFCPKCGAQRKVD